VLPSAPSELLWSSRYSLGERGDDFLDLFRSYFWADDSVAGAVLSLLMLALLLLFYVLLLLGGMVLVLLFCVPDCRG